MFHGWYQYKKIISKKTLKYGGERRPIKKALISYFICSYPVETMETQKCISWKKRNSNLSGKLTSKQANSNWKCEIEHNYSKLTKEETNSDIK